jgi:histidinol-phosphate aminotransferase
MSVPDFDALANPGIRKLRAYDPGHDIVELRRRFPGGKLVELGSNENPYGPSRLAREALLACLPDVHRYSDPLGTDLKRALAEQHHLQTSQLMLGNGSHELLMMIAQAFAGPGSEVVASEFGFAVYAIAAQAADARFKKARALAPSDQMARGHDLESLAAAVSDATRLVYLANPNNPTGTWFSTAALDQFLARMPITTLVVVDEAYLEYVMDPGLVSAISLLPRYPNLLVTRTFSKAYGLAGMRVGYACACPELLGVLERVRESFNVSSPGLAACAAALLDQDHLSSVKHRNFEERARLAGELGARGLAVAPSQTNFLLVDFGREASPIEAALIERGVVLRPMAGYGLPNCLRITVGTGPENQALLIALDEALA